MARHFRETVVGPYSGAGGAGTPVPPIDPGPEDVFHTHPNIQALKQVDMDADKNPFFNQKIIVTTDPVKNDW
jgi:hypothetical protein